MTATMLQLPNKLSSRPRRQSRSRRPYSMSSAKVMRPTSTLQSLSPQVEANVTFPHKANTGSSDCAFTGIQFLVILASLPDDDVEIEEPFIITVEHVGEDDYLASVPEVNLNASGDSTDEVIDNLQDIIAGTYRLLMSLPIKKLGPEPLRQWKFLKFHLR